MPTLQTIVTGKWRLAVQHVSVLWKEFTLHSTTLASPFHSQPSFRVWFWQPKILVQLPTRQGIFLSHRTSTKNRRWYNKKVVCLAQSNGPLSLRESLRLHGVNLGTCDDVTYYGLATMARFQNGGSNQCISV